MSPVPAHNNITVLLSQTNRSHTDRHCNYNLLRTRYKRVRRRLRRGELRCSRAISSLPYGEFFHCLLSRKKIFPLKLKQPSKLTRRFPGLAPGMRNTVVSLMPTIGRRYLGKTHISFNLHLLTDSQSCDGFKLSFYLRKAPLQEKNKLSKQVRKALVIIHRNHPFACSHHLS